MKHASELKLHLRADVDVKDCGVDPQRCIINAAYRAERSGESEFFHAIKLEGPFFTDVCLI